MLLISVTEPSSESPRVQKGRDIPMTYKQAQAYLAENNVQLSITRDGYFRVAQDGNLWHYAKSLESAIEIGELLADCDSYTATAWVS